MSNELEDTMSELWSAGAAAALRLPKTAWGHWAGEALREGQPDILGKRQALAGTGQSMVEVGGKLVGDGGGHGSSLVRAIISTKAKKP